jgi:hypothetical protein
VDEPPADWWSRALASDEPVVTLREWRSGEHIVMNTAAFMLMLPEGLGASYAEWVDDCFPS